MLIFLMKSLKLFFPYLLIVNASLLSGVFPSSLKKGVIHPLIKKLSLDREAYPSYRTITNVAFVLKMLERVAATLRFSCFSLEIYCNFRVSYTACNLNVAL